MKKHWESEFFVEKRLIFQDSPEKPGAGESLESKTDKLLADLQAEIKEGKGGDKDKDKDEKPPTYHTDRRATRDIVDPKPRHERSAEIAKQAVEYEGLLQPKEVSDIQKTHEHLYTQYMNPAFMMALQQLKPKEKADKVYAQLDAALKHPFLLHYKSLGNGIFEIVKAQPPRPEAVGVPDDLNIRIEGADGHITKVAGIDVDVSMSNSAYNKEMPNYRKRFDNEFILKGKYKEPYEEISDEMKEIYTLENIEFPKRLISLIEARSDLYPFEKQDTRIQTLIERQKKQGKTYEEITKNKLDPHGGLQIFVAAHPKKEGAYRIYIVKTADGQPERTYDLSKNIIDVDSRGFLLKQTSEGDYEVDARYKERLRRRYYNVNPKAKEMLKDKGKDLEAIDADEKLTEELRTAVFKRLETADLDTVKKVAKAISPASHDANIDEAKNVVPMRKVAKEQIDHSRDKIHKAAAALGISGAKPSASPEAKEAPKTEREKVNAALEKADFATLKKAALATIPDGIDARKRKAYEDNINQFNDTGADKAKMRSVLQKLMDGDTNLVPKVASAIGV